MLLITTFAIIVNVPSKNIGKNTGLVECHLDTRGGEWNTYTYWCGFSAVGLHTYRMLGSSKLLEGNTSRDSIYRGEFLANIKVLEGRKKNVWLRVADIENSDSLFGMNWSDDLGMTGHGLCAVLKPIDFGYQNQQKRPHWSGTSDDNATLHLYSELIKRTPREKDFPAKTMKQIWFRVRINGSFTELLWDTGAAYTIIPINLYEQLDLPPLTKSEMKLLDFSGNELPIIGRCSANVQMGSQEATEAPLYVSSGVMSPLFRFEWYEAFGLIDSGLSSLM